MIVAINSGAPGPVEWSAGQHPGVEVAARPGSAVVTLDRERAWPSRDVAVDYAVWRKSLTATLHVAPPKPAAPDAPAASAGAGSASGYGGGDAASVADASYFDDAEVDGRGSFLLMVSPPGPECSTPFARSVVFMLDRSGSMEGEPLSGAKAALAAGLGTLTRHDQFTVVAFDHEQLWWTGESRFFGGELTLTSLRGSRVLGGRELRVESERLGVGGWRARGLFLRSHFPST